MATFQQRAKSIIDAWFNADVEAPKVQRIVTDYSTAKGNISAASYVDRAAFFVRDTRVDAMTAVRQLPKAEAAQKAADAAARQVDTDLGLTAD